MSLDALSISLLAKELNNKLKGGKIDKLHQPSRDEVNINIRAFGENLKLLLSAKADSPRVYITKESKENPLSPPIFCQSLRKHLLGAVVISISQIEFERIIKIDLSCYNEFNERVLKSLIIEIMGRHSNIILVDEDGIIINCIKHIDFTVSSKRLVLPNLKYELPPSQDKLNPMKLEKCDFHNILKDNSSEIGTDKFLLNSLLGISPLIAREISFIALKDTSVPLKMLSDNKKDALADAAYDFFDNIKKGCTNPCIIENEKTGELIDFAPVSITQYGGSGGSPNSGSENAELSSPRPKENNPTALSLKAGGIASGSLPVKMLTFNSINETICSFFHTKSSREIITARSASIIKVINNNIDRCNKKLGFQKKALDDAKNKDTYKLYGDLIVANIYRLKENTKGATLINYYEEGMPEIYVPFDIKLSPKANANRYFKLYSKAKTAEVEAKKQLILTLEELNYLESVLLSVSSCETTGDLAEIRGELYENGYIDTKINHKKERVTASSPHEYKSSDGFKILCGKNNIQNDMLTLKMAKNHDIWLHTKNIPGSHTIIFTEGKEVPETTIIEAAMIAAYHSKAQSSTNVPVDYTTVKNVKKPRGAKPGMVIYDFYNTVYVQPDSKR